MGSQLGDEELLGLYFMVNQCARYLERTFFSSDFAPKIWMWCLDSAVGRKVVLVWTLVSTFPHSVHQILTDSCHSGHVHWTGAEGHDKVGNTNVLI